MSAHESSGSTWWLLWKVRGVWNALDFEREHHAQSFQVTMEIQGGVVVAAKTRHGAIRFIENELVPGQQSQATTSTMQ